MSEEFDLLSRSIFLTLTGGFPHWGTLWGLHEHDDDLPDAGPEVVADRWNELRRAAEPLLCLESSALTAEERIDCAVVQHAMDYMQFSLVGIERWKKDPDALSTIGLALCAQLWREYAPLDERMDQLAGRLDKLPDYLDAYRGQVLDPVPLWVDMAIDSAAEMPAFFQTIAATAERSVSPGVQERLNRAVDRAAQATDAYYNWLVQDVRPRAAGEWATGPDVFAELCTRRELGLDVAAIRELATDLLDRGCEEMAHLANEVRPGGNVDQALDAAYAEYPRTFPGVFDEYSRAMRHCHRFVFKAKLATLPEDDELAFQETPAFLRHLFPLAGYIPPGRFDDIQEGTYLVTAPADPEDMRLLHNASTIVNTTVHEAYPGHHLQAVVANRRAPLLRFLPSFVGSAGETTRGWALYSEHLMADHGFHGTSQRRLIQMRDHCWSAARVLADVGMHTGEMTIADATELLSGRAKVPAAAAAAEVQAMTRDPGAFMSYLIGAYELMRLREDIEARMGDAFDLCWFHDSVLAAGHIPLTYVRRVLETAAAEAGG